MVQNDWRIDMPHIDMPSVHTPFNNDIVRQIQEGLDRRWPELQIFPYVMGEGDESSLLHVRIRLPTGSYDVHVPYTDRGAVPENATPQAIDELISRVIAPAIAYVKAIVE